MPRELTLPISGTDLQRFEEKTISKEEQLPLVGAGGSNATKPMQDQKRQGPKGHRKLALPSAHADLQANPVQCALGGNPSDYETFLKVLNGDALETLKTLPDESIQCCVTSPPYWGLRDYGVAGQIGLEKTPEEYVAKLVAVFGEVRRVLKSDGTLWMNLGDSYASTWSCSRVNAVGNGACDKGQRAIRTGNGIKEKDLIGIPWLVAFALRAAGWYLRCDIIWSKPNPMPESVTDRPTKAHEYIFLMTKSAKYYYDAEAIAEPVSPESWHKSDFRRSRNLEIHPNIGTGNRNARSETRNKRSVWPVATMPYAEAHFATFPPDLIKPCILAGSKPGDTILDPFGGSGTSGMVALELGRKAVLIELKPDYCAMIKDRCNVTPGLGV